MPFSLGVRGCFGKKMAQNKLRTVIALVVWRFVLEKCPAKLSTAQAVDGLTHRPKHSYVRLSTAY
jgi:cytochrome P450